MDKRIDCLNSWLKGPQFFVGVKGTLASVSR